MLRAVAPLHPICLTDIPPEGLARARAHYTPEVERLLRLAEELKQRPQPLGPDDVLRLILVVQCNAFYSGFYLL